MIRFTTASGTEYTLEPEAEVLVKTEPGQALADALQMHRGTLTRHGVRALRHIEHGTDMAEPAGEFVLFPRHPTLGESFVYHHPTLNGCISTPVTSIIRIKDRVALTPQEERNLCDQCSAEGLPNDCPIHTPSTH